MIHLQRCYQPTKLQDTAVMFICNVVRTSTRRFIATVFITKSYGVESWNVKAYEVITAVLMKNQVFLDIKPCQLINTSNH